MTEAQAGAVHDLALAFGAVELDVASAPDLSVDVTAYTTPADGDRVLVAAFSVSRCGTARSRPWAVSA